MIPTRAPDLVFDLWPDAVPGEVAGHGVVELNTNDDGVQRIARVVRPRVYVFKAIAAAPAAQAVSGRGGATVLVFPGGGYSRLAMDHNGGHPVQRWLNSVGVHAAVVKYRLPSAETMADPSVGPLQDAQRALRIVRRHADQWSSYGGAIGVYGASAGGHLAASLSTRFDEAVYPAEADAPSARLDFALLMCPVITMIDPLVHRGSRRLLLGDHPPAAQLDRFSAERHVGSGTPPTALFHALDDTSVSYQNSLLYLDALRQAGVAAEAHFYERGGHGFKLGREGESNVVWPANAESWMRMHGWV